MFTTLIVATALIVVAAMFYVWDGSHDAFHPLLFIGPMMLFQYCWMPWKLDSVGGLAGYFQPDQLQFVQALNLLGIACFIWGCLSAGVRPSACSFEEAEVSPSALVTGGLVVGLLGLAAWAVAIVNVGGFRAAFSSAYAGGWDDNGYVRDGSLLMFPGFLLVAAGVARQPFRVYLIALLAALITPWVLQAALTGRRGPTFVIATILSGAWFLNRRTRPPLLVTVAGGITLGGLLLFLVTNRGSLFLGSDKQLTTDVSAVIEKPDTGNEYIYGAGNIISAMQRHKFYWGRRYLAEILVRPVPSAIWPTKYEDFGIGEVMHNAGTGEGFNETLGWTGAEGSAPGIVADLWIEVAWLCLPALFLFGRAYAMTWRLAVSRGGPWIVQYTIVAALSIYFVMQTMEAVIFRVLLLSVPVWVSWNLAQLRPVKPIDHFPAEQSFSSQ